jgi:uncharacterized phage protein (TIGR02218 family)
MTYASIEESTYGGAPIELYKFDQGGVNFWYYTSADEDQTYSGDVYSAVSIGRNSLEQAQEIEKAALQITMPTDIDFLDQFIGAGTTPTNVVNLTLFRFHHGDTNVVTTWVGRVVNVTFDGYEAVVTCESVHSSLMRPMGRRLYQTNCSHVLYGAPCGVTKSAYKVPLSGITVSGLDIIHPTLATFAVGYFRGGSVEFVDGGLIVPRTILQHSGTVITLNLALTGAATGADVDVYPGCNHTTTTCYSTFDNIANYGGQPFYPKQNPFEAGSLNW